WRPGPRRSRNRATVDSGVIGSISSRRASPLPTNATATPWSATRSIGEPSPPVMSWKIGSASAMERAAIPTWSSGSSGRGVLPARGAPRAGARMTRGRLLAAASDGRKANTRAAVEPRRREKGERDVGEREAGGGDGRELRHGDRGGEGPRDRGLLGRVVRAVPDRGTGHR